VATVSERAGKWAKASHIAPYLGQIDYATLKDVV